MLSKDSEVRQENLTKILIKLASKILSEPELDEVAHELERVYANDFSHNYSLFFPVVTALGSTDLLDLEYLSNNIELLKKYIEQSFTSEENEFKALYPRLQELSIHLSLEIMRYFQFSRHDERIEGLEARYLKVLDETTEVREQVLCEVQKARERMQIEVAQFQEQINSEVKTTKRQLSKASKQISSLQTELIAVLSIFAAIVLTFAGGMSFIGSALTSIASVSPFKSAFFILLCGFVELNILFILMYFIAKITGRSIYARCKTPDCTCIHASGRNCRSFMRVCRRLPYVFWLNASIFAMMLLDAIAWVLQNHFHLFYL